MRVSLGNLQGYNNTKKQDNVNFGTNKAVYLCSSLASGFVPTKEIPTIKDFIVLNMEKALGHAKGIVERGDFPYWNHSTWPKFLDDTKPEQRKTAMSGCLDLATRCDVLVYHGEAKGGMLTEMSKANEIGEIVLSRAEYEKMVDEGTFDKFVEDSPHYKRLHNVLDNEANLEIMA